MRPLAESSLHPRRQGDAGFAEFVSHPVHGRKGVLPFIVGRAAEQVSLLRSLPECRRLYSKQSHFGAFAPVGLKEFPNLQVNFVVKLGRDVDGAGAGDGGEILVAQLELQSPRMEIVLP